MRRTLTAPAPPPADADLVRDFRAGDDGAFAELVARHRRGVEAQLRLMLRGRDRTLAEDLAQDVFLRAWIALRRDDREVVAGPWLRRIAVNRAVDELRRRRPEPLGDAEPQDPGATLGRDAADAASERAELREVLSAVSALPARQRRALAGHAFQSLPYTAIADEAGTTPRAVKSLVHRARQSVREAVGEAA